MRKTIFLVSTILLSALPLSAHAQQFYFGADLSYVNEMRDCGAKYSYKRETDPFKIFAKSGHNLMRVRLWVNPTWTNYSNYQDVVKTLERAKAAGMQTLLDFHYSDDWADGDKQLVPKAWEALDEDAQAKALYDNTFQTLKSLDALGLMPNMVQVGNETNGEILSTLEAAKNPINWARNAKLFNAGIMGVRDAGSQSAIKPKIMLHIAQPENVEPWFENAHKNGVLDYDIIGISYYRKWSKYSPEQFGQTVKNSKQKFGKEVILVETAYPFTEASMDENVNLMGADSSFPKWGVSVRGQLNYLKDMTQLVIDNGGIGLVYWEPAWVSTKCKTRWGTGSNWENATFFDFNGRATRAIEWPKARYNLPRK